MKRCVEKQGTIMPVYYLELVSVADEREEFTDNPGNNMVATENYLYMPHLLGGDLVMVKREFYYVLELPKTPMPTDKMKLGEVKSDKVLYTQQEHVRFPTFDEELLCVCTFMNEEDIEHFLLSWEIDLVHTLIHTDPRMHKKTIEGRTKGWSSRVVKKLKGALENVLVEASD
jgi:hypothetical protein